MEFRNALKALRSELGITQEELANALHINSATISRWELGKSTPNRSTASALLNYARARSASPECCDELLRTVMVASKQRLEISGNQLTAVEHASLRQIIDDASFPLYVCDIKTDELLYINRKMEELLGGSLAQLPNKKCYACLMHRETPCEFCHKEQLVTDRFIAHDAFRPDDQTHYRVQGKRIMWNGRKAQVRYIFDIAGAIDATAQQERETSYQEQLRIRRQQTGSAVATAHFNLTRNTVTNVASRNQELAALIKNQSFDEVFAELRANPFSEEDQSKLQSVSDCAGMIQQFYAGKTHISIKYYSQRLGGYYENTFDLMQNPVTYDIEAYSTLWDITDAAMAANIADRLLAIDYETIIAIDAETGKGRPFLSRHIHEFISEQQALGDNSAGMEAYLRKYCPDDEVEAVIKGTSLPYIKEQLLKKPYYHIAYTLKKGDKLIYKRTMYTYLDKRKAIILCAMQDLTDIHALENEKRNKLPQNINKEYKPMTRENLIEAGIDYDGGVQRFMGKTQLYEKYLLKFFEKNSLSELRGQIESGDHEAAFRTAHGIKGVCGNLSMVRLYDTLSELTEHLRSGGQSDKALSLYQQAMELYDKAGQAARA